MESWGVYSNLIEIGVIVKTRSVLLALVFQASLLPACFGQASAINGTIEGTILDPSGAPVAKLNVQAINQDTGFKQQVQTADSGLYRFNVLPLGTYEIDIDNPGFSTVKRSGVVVTAGAIATVDVTLAVKGVSTEVLVSSDAAITEPARTDLGNTLSLNELTNLPLVSRNPYNFILLQPNVSGHPNTEFGVPRKIDANGFNGRIYYEIDGSNNTESDRAGIRLVPLSDTYIQEVQQVNNGFAPEFGNTVGTVFNTITKSGSNQYHGEFGYLFRRTDFNARPKLLAPTAATPTINVDSYIADSGGRIIKDKLFYFGAFEHVKRDLPSVVTVPAATIAQLGLPANYAAAIPFSQSVYFYMFKVDYQLDQSNRISFRYNHHANDSPYNNGGGLVLLPLTYNFIDRSHAGAIQLVSTLSPNAVNEVRFQTIYRGQSQNRFAPNVSGPTINITGVARFGGPDQVGFVYQETSPEGSDNFSFNVGTHALKFGLNVRAITDLQVQATSAAYTFSSVAAYLATASGATPKGYSTFVQTFGNPAIQYDSLFSSFYAQDTWKPFAKMTVSYGLRYDIYKVPKANSGSPFPASRQFRTDKNNFAPRLGIAYALTPKTVVRASGGIFYDPPQTDQYRRAILNNGLPNFFNISAAPTDPFAPQFPAVFNALPQGFALATQDITTVARDFRTLYSENANVTVTHALSSNTSINASYLYTHGVGLPIYRDINVIPSGQTLADGRPIFGTARVYPGFNGILSAESAGTSVYNAGNIWINHRLSSGIELFATYTWAHAIDDAPEQNNIDSAAAFLSDPTNRRRDRGNSLTDRRHSFNASAVLNPKVPIGGRYLNGFTLSIAFVAQSGDVFNEGSNRTLNGDTTEPAAYQRPLYIGRNTIRGPSVYELNARLIREFTVRERFRLQAFAESTNVFNHDNITGLNTTASVDTLGNILSGPSLAATTALDQRLIQIGFKAIF
ncbi:MAG: Cna domain protein [Bryobacterales bacterium]|nr:Cna domain protein [Bryobacterales bacterium]